MVKKISNLTCWIVTEGIAGTENQCLGVAEALGVQADIKRISLTQPWKSLSPYLGFECAGSFKPRLLPPWPDILIASGRKSVAAARYIKKKSKGKTFTVQIQDPRIRPSSFDLVAVPQHDPTRGDNVVVTIGNPNRITTKRLEQASVEFSSLGHMQGTRIAVLIGGTSKAYQMTPRVMYELCDGLKQIEGSLMITASRRTGEENLGILQAQLHDREDCLIWDGTGPNPYFGYLAWADIIMVSADSSSMLSEAGTTGKPVYIIPMEGGSPRMEAFHQNLINCGAARFFDKKLENWSYKPLNDAQKVAERIIQDYQSRTEKRRI